MYHTFLSSFPFLLYALLHPASADGVIVLALSVSLCVCHYCANTQITIPPSVDKG